MPYDILAIFVIATLFGVVVGMLVQHLWENR